MLDPGFACRAASRGQLLLTSRQGRSDMQQYRHAWVLILLVVLTPSAKAQSRNAAQDYFDRGRQHYERGDFDRAIADFTRAIEISSVPGANHREQRQNW